MKKYVLLDRDGTIIVNKHYQKDPAETEILPHAGEALQRLRAAGFGLILVTNQSGIGRGILTETDMAAVNESMIRLLEGDGGLFDGIYHCPHVDADKCRCRKPLPGMLETASRDFCFRLAESYVVGDRDIDIEAGLAAGATTILVRTGYGAETEDTNRVAAEYVADDLLDAANWILAREAALGV